MNCAVIVYVRKEVLRNNVLSKFKAGQMILSRSVGVGGGEVEIDESLINLRQRQLFEIEVVPFLHSENLGDIRSHNLRHHL